MTVFNTTFKNDHTQALAFLDPEGRVSLQRYDTMKYKQFDKLTDKQLGFFWRPEEVDITRDSKDFKSLTDNEKHIFTSNLKRQILLDSVQGRAPTEAFSTLVSIPELEAWIQTWTFSETIHSRSYTHIIRNIYNNPSEVFDQLLEIKEIVDCAQSISEEYNSLVEYTKFYELFGEGEHLITSGNKETQQVSINKFELKRKLWRTLVAVNILEGIRFYVSFACSWAFAELKKMEGNAKIIKFIARDENLHLASTQTLLKILPKDDPDFAKISTEEEDYAISLFEAAVDQEKEWAKYLFADGSMIGLNYQLLSNYIEWIATKRMVALGLKSPYTTTQANPLPWTQKWISGGEVQVAPQEVELSSYVIGGVKQDIEKDTFSGFKL